jgi:hypothetical protein
MLLNNLESINQLLNTLGVSSRGCKGSSTASLGLDGLEWVRIGQDGTYWSVSGQRRPVIVSIALFGRGSSSKAHSRLRKGILTRMSKEIGILGVVTMVLVSMAYSSLDRPILTLQSR